MIFSEKIIQKKLDKLAEAIVQYDGDTASTLSMELLALGIEPRRIINEGLSKGMQVVNDKFNRLEVFLPHLIFATDAMQSVVGKITAHLPKEKKEELTLGKVVLGTVTGDIHDMGKNIFKILLLAAGFEVYDLGVDVPNEFFVNRAEEVTADIIALSCLMTTTLMQLKEVIEDLIRLNIRDKYKVLVGGGAVTKEWAEKIGADGYAAEATKGVELAKKVLRKD